MLYFFSVFGDFCFFHCTRKTVSYKHHFSATVDTAEAFSVSQEVLDQRNATPYKASIKIKPTANLHPTSFDQPCNLHSTDTNNIHLLATEREGSVILSNISLITIVERDSE